MVKLFYQGGPFFMGVLSLLLLIMLIVAVINGMPLFRVAFDSKGDVFRKLGYIKSLGLLALVVGVMGQLIGLYYAFNAVEAADDISPAILAGGLKVSLIAPIYGFFIFILSYLIWFVLSYKLRDVQ